MTEQVADAVVVGAGPAGCVMSYLLAKSGVETVLIERQQTLDRKFRGTGFRPPIPRLLDEMGLRSDLNDLPHETITQGTIVAHGTPYPVFDFEDDRILLMKQPPLLRLLVERAQEFDSFTFHSGTTFDRFRHEDDTIAGVRATTRPSGETIEIRSRVVIGADGRYSTTRQAAGIDAGIQKTGTEVVWFRLPCAATDFTTHIRIENDGILVYSPLNEHESQYGLLIPRGQYSAIRDRGIERFRETISGIEPALATSVNAHLESFEQCSLLSVESGLAERWADNGFLLIGDAAHVASPIGAEGNNLAIQDAIAAHRTLTPALRHGDGPIAETILQQIEHARRPAVESTIDGQRSRGQGLSRLLTARERIPNVLEPLLVRGGAALISTIAQFSNGTAETNAPSVEQSLFCT
jgi:2-polyprenyl-6-methoxyphenol hydroxylase-like FAD-dependent oxidoreductase